MTPERIHAFEHPGYTFKPTDDAGIFRADGTEWDGETGREALVGIDVTKGFPFTGDVDDHENDIPRYKDGNQYYQWAVLKIVGMDVPLVLDAIPRERGQSKDEIVEKLLTHATEMVNLDFVMMDREFDSEGVKDTCEEYGVHYLNPTRIFERSDEDDTIERLIYRYRHRWGIENGFKKQKHFMVRTTSTERNYRFFNFAFACVLYNVWRLVDLLVKLVLDGKNRSYSPRVDANQFLIGSVVISYRISTSPWIRIPVKSYNRPYDGGQAVLRTRPT